MLHWQLLKWLKGLSLGTKIVCISIIGHLWVLFSLFVLYRGSSPYNITVTGTMINTDVPIVFMPLHKSLNTNGSGQKKNGGGQKNSTQVCVNNTQDSTIAKPVKEKAKTIIAESASTKKQKNKKDKHKKQTKKEAVKKNAAKKKAELEKKEEPIKKPVQEPIKPPVEEVKIVEQESSQTQNASLNSDAPAADGENVLYVGQQEMEALQMQDYIQQEMAQHWSPPSGMRKDLMCIIKVVVAFDGTLASIDFDQSSGVLLFDGAAKKAASQLQPPRWAYGKELLITFKP